MTWTDIEAKWAAMARRVQSEQVQDDDDTVIVSASEQPSLRADATGLRATPLPDRPSK